MRINNVIILTIIAGTVLGCVGTSGENKMPVSNQNNLPIIKADDEHMQVQRNDNVSPPAYEISSGDGFVLDTTGYKIQIPTGLHVDQPNMIQVVLDKQTYYVSWDPGITSYTLSSQTLKPLQGAGPFSGFKSGIAVILAIGYLDSNGQTTGRVAFYPLWDAIVNVR